MTTTIAHARARRTFDGNDLPCHAARCVLASVALFEDARFLSRAKELPIADPLEKTLSVRQEQSRTALTRMLQLDADCLVLLAPTGHRHTRVVAQGRPTNDAVRRMLPQRRHQHVENRLFTVGVGHSLAESDFAARRDARSKRKERAALPEHLLCKRENRVQELVRISVLCHQRLARPSIRRASDFFVSWYRAIHHAAAVHPAELRYHRARGL